MEFNITYFVRSLLPNFLKSDIEVELETSINSISVIRDNYEKLKTILEGSKFNGKSNKKILDTIYDEWKKFKPHGVRITMNKNIAVDTLNLYRNVEENGKFVYEEIHKLLNDNILTASIDFYAAHLLRAVSHYTFMTKFSLDLLNYLYIKEIEDMNIPVDKDYLMHPKQVEKIEKNAWIYARLLSFYGSSPDYFKTEISNIEKIYVNKSNIDELVSQFIASAKDKIETLPGIPSGFIGSPIFHLRLIFAEWEAQRYHYLKSKKQLLELRYLHYKMLKESGKSDPNIEKEIEYLQKRITDIDYKLDKIEKSIEE